MSGFHVEFDEFYFVAAYLYASISIKPGPVALVETYVLMFSASLCSSHSKLGLQSAFESDHRRLLLNSPPADAPTSSSLICFFCRNPLWKYVKYCLLTIMVYLLGIQCINVFNYTCFECVSSVFARAMLHAYLLAASVIVNKSGYNRKYGQAEWRRPVWKVAHSEHLFKIHRDAVLVKLW